jgi:hypothetical protein
MLGFTDNTQGGSSMATAVMPIVETGISLLLKIFGGNKTPYHDRLAAVATAIANSRQMPVGAYMSSGATHVFLAFYPGGGAQQIASNVDSTNAGYVLQTWVNQQGTTCVLITAIEPTQTKDVMPTDIVAPPVGGTTPVIVGTTPSGPGSVESNWPYYAAGAIALWLILKKR